MEYQFLSPTTSDSAITEPDNPTPIYPVDPQMARVDSQYFVQQSSQPQLVGQQTENQLNQQNQLVFSLLLEHNWKRMLALIYNRCVEHPHLISCPDVLSLLKYNLKMVKDQLSDEELFKAFMLKYVRENDLQSAHKMLEASFAVSFYTQEEYEMVINLVRHAAADTPYEPQEEIGGKIFSLEEVLKLYSFFHEGSYPSDENVQRFVNQLNEDIIDGDIITLEQVHEFFNSLRVKQNRVAHQAGAWSIHIDAQQVQFVHESYVRRPHQPPTGDNVVVVSAPEGVLPLKILDAQQLQQAEQHEDVDGAQHERQYGIDGQDRSGVGDVFGQQHDDPHVMRQAVNQIGQDNLLQLDDSTIELLRLNCEFFYNERVADPNFELCESLLLDLKINMTFLMTTPIDQALLFKLDVLLSICQGNLKHAYKILEQPFTVSLDQDDYYTVIKLIRDAAATTPYDPEEKIEGSVFNLREMLQLYTFYYRGRYLSNKKLREYANKMNESLVDDNNVTGEQIQSFFSSMREKQKKITYKVENSAPLNLQQAQNSLYNLGWERHALQLKCATQENVVGVPSPEFVYSGGFINAQHLRVDTSLEQQSYQQPVQHQHLSQNPPEAAAASNHDLLVKIIETQNRFEHKLDEIKQQMLQMQNYIDQHQLDQQQNKRRRRKVRERRRQREQERSNGTESQPSNNGDEAMFEYYMQQLRNDRRSEEEDHQQSDRYRREIQMHVNAVKSALDCYRLK